ncbi:MAG: AAA family ATPase [Thermoanaerobaculia bacterium]|nr:AAA family ATPase [Thermoanaerobaculia bacterium]
MHLSSDTRLAFLKRIELENIRAFRHLVLELGEASVQPQMQTVVIGRNGTCKTTLLRSIALGLATEGDAAALLSLPNGRWITEGEKEGSIRLWIELADRSEVQERVVRLRSDGRKDTLDTREPSPVSPWEVFLCAYGLGRGNLGGEPGRGYRVIDSVATLFRYEDRLVHSELVLRRLKDFLGTETFKAVLAGMKRALGLSPEHDIELPSGGGIEVSGPGLGEHIPLEGWADGYRMTLSWMIDFFGWAMRAEAIDTSGEVRGILLIDEIEQHLHPAMQADLLGHLRQALPGVQTLVTTHSPLVALSTPSEQLVALHRDDTQIRRAEVPSLTGFSAEDVLVEETLFGTDPYAPATRLKIDRHQELKRIPPTTRSKKQEREIRELADELRPDALPALRDDPVVAKLDELTALLEAQGREK